MGNETRKRGGKRAAEEENWRRRGRVVGKIRGEGEKKVNFRRGSLLDRACQKLKNAGRVSRNKRRKGRGGSTVGGYSPSW